MRGPVDTVETVTSEGSRPALYLALTKPDVSFLVVLTTMAGYVLGTHGPLDWLRMAHTVFGTTLIAAGTSALNHYIERDTDALMRRTASRPLPSGQLRPREALWFGGGLVAGGTLYLALATNELATLLGFFTSITYLLAYTPLKRGFPRRCAPVDRLGCRPRDDYARRLDLIQRPVLVAVPALRCHCLDLPGRLRTRGNSNASGGGLRWDTHVP